MSNRYTPLWIDPFEGRLYAGWQNTQAAPTLTFKQGDDTGVELFLVKKSVLSGSQETLEFPAGCTIRLAIGKLDASATGGTMVISYDGDSTSPLAYNASESAIQTAISGLPSIVDAGGATVTLVSRTTIRLAFNTVGAKATPVLDASAITPSSSAKVIAIREGSSTNRAIYLLKVSQSVCVFQDTWADSEEPTITATTLVANQSKRVTIAPLPLSGSWSLTTTADIEKKVDDDDGVTTNVPTYWNESVTGRLSVFDPSFVDSTGSRIWQMDIIQVDTTSWDFTVRNNYEVPVDYTMPFLVSGNFTKFPSKIANLNFNTVEVETLLNGAATAQAVLEVEVEKENGERWTILQTTCTIVNDLIDQDDYSPISIPRLAEEAPMDGSLYARKDGAWEAFLPEDNQGITEAPVDGTPYLRLDGTWSSDIDGGTY